MRDFQYIGLVSKKKSVRLDSESTLVVWAEVTINGLVRRIGIIYATALTRTVLRVHERYLAVLRPANDSILTLDIA